MTGQATGSREPGTYGVFDERIVSGEVRGGRARTISRC
jgi:hypothetical protein